jgi:hypothetical protein
MSVAIGGNRDPFGVLAAYSREQRNFIPDDTAFIQSVANIVNLAAQRLTGEVALRRSEEHCGPNLRGSSGSISVIDQAGAVRYANHARYFLATTSVIDLRTRLRRWFITKT